MKKKLVLMLIITFIGVILGGCGDSLSEEEIRAQVEAELEAEEELREQLEEEIRAELEAERAADKDAGNEGVTTNEGIGGTNDIGDTPLETEPITFDNPTIKIMGNTLNVRDAAGSDGNVVGTVSEGEFYTFINVAQDSDEDYLDWYQIKLTDGTQGWVAGWYCVEYSSGTTYEARQALELGFDGYLDGISVAIGETSEELFSAYGEPISSDGSGGGAVAYYNGIWFFMQDYSYGTPPFEILTMGCFDTSVFEGGTLYGLSIGMTEAEVEAIVGEPNYVSIVEGDDGEIWEVYHPTYVLGNYDFIIKYNLESKKIESFKLSEHSMYHPPTDEELDMISGM